MPVRQHLRLSRRECLATLALVVPALAACGAPSAGSIPAAGTAASNAVVKPTAAATSGPSVASTSAAAAQPTPVTGASTATKPASANAQAAQNPQSNAVVYGTFADAQILNPFLSTDTASSGVTGLIFEGLVKADPKTGAAIPSLAESWEQSPDGLSYTFRIRPNVKWSDGQPFTAEDAKFTFDTILDPKTQTVRKNLYDKVKTFEVPDPMTLKVTLKESYCPFLLSSMGMGLVPKHILSKSADINKDDFNSKSPLGTGPYMFKEWKKDDHLSLVANPNYWQGKPKIEQWIMKVVKDANVVAAQLKTGEVDYSTVQPDALEDMQKQPNVNVSTYYARSYDYIGYNLDRPMFQDKRVRQAFTYALDRDVFVQKILYGQGQVINAPIPPVSWAYNAKVPSFKYNIDTAKKLLQDAGWTPGADGLLQKDGKPLKFTLVTNSGNKVREQIATIAQDQLKKIGVQVDTNLMEWNAFLDKVNKTHDFDAIVLGWSLGIDPDQKSIWSTSEYPNGLNSTKYSNPEVDTLLEQARRLPGCSQEGRKALYDTFQERISDDQPYTFLYIPKTLLITNKRLQGIEPSVWSGVAWNIHQWSLSQ